MFLGWLSRLCATFLVPILFLATLGFTLNQTVFKGEYIKNQLQQANAYSKLSDGISKNAAKNNTVPGVSAAQLQTQLKTIISPAVLQTKINTTIDEFVAYYNGKGPAPTLDVSDLLAQAKAAGLPTPDDPKLQHPIALPVAVKAKDASDKIHMALLLGGSVTVLLTLAIIAIAFARRNFKPIANVVIAVGIVVLLAGLTFYLLPNTLSTVVKVGSGDDGFVDIARDLATNIAHDLGKRLLVTGVGYLVVGIAANILLRRFGQKKPVPELFRDDMPAPNPVAPRPAMPPPPTPQPAPTRKIQL